MQAKKKEKGLLLIIKDKFDTIDITVHSITGIKACSQQNQGTIKQTSKWLPSIFPT